MSEPLTTSGPSDRPHVISISPATAGREDAPRARPDTSDPPSAPRWLGMFLSLALALTVVMALVFGVVLAATHARDRYWINVASGSWLALAWSANHGEWYPPLRDDAGNFAGTRYMPLYIAAHAALSRATGEYIFSGKIIAYSAAIAWLLAIVMLARQRGSSPLFAAALAASVLLSPVGLQALCTVRSDGLALAMQLWALWVAGRITRSGHLGAGACAGALCGLAFVTKLSAVWAALAIGVWLLWRNRAAMAAFIVAAIIPAAATLAMAQMLSDGRMLDNLLHAGASGWQGWGSVLLWSQRRMLAFVSEWSPTTWVLAPAAALSLLLALARRELRLLHIAWVACCATLAVMYADIGVGENHIVELAAITAVLAGDLWGRAAVETLATHPRSGGWSIAQMLLAVAVAWSSLAVLKQRLWSDFADTLAVLRTGQVPAKHDPRGFDELLTGKRFLSDDPSIAVLLDRKPVVSDAFIFRGFQQTHPQWEAELVERINRRDFDAVVLLRDADPASWWYSELFFGSTVVEAIATNYRFDREVGVHRVYVKNDG